MLRQIHHAAVIGVCLIKLEHRELGIVPRRNPLIPEVAINLVHAVEPANREPLQIQLRRNPQIKIDVQRVVMRHKRPCDRASRDGLHHRRFDFNETASAEKIPHGLNQLRALQKNFAYLGIHEQIDIPLPIP